MSRSQKYNGADDADPSADSKKRNDTEDLELIIEGRTVMTSSGLLSKNSNVFATLISNARATRADENDLLTHCAKGASSEKVTLEMPNLKYKDVKLMVTCMESAFIAKEKITGLEAFRILPMVEQFRMKRLKKVCATALYDSLLAMRKDLGTGCISQYDVLQYLTAADLYNFDKVRQLCVDELASRTDAPNRQMVLRDKHINEKTKLKILDKICDNMDEDYADKLRKLRNDMDERCRKIEETRDEFTEQLKTWKNNAREEVDEMLKTNADTHKQFVNDLYQKKVMDRTVEQLKEIKESLCDELKTVYKDISSLLGEMENLNVYENYKELADLKGNLRETLESNRQNIEGIIDWRKYVIEKNLKICQLSEKSSLVFSSAKTLEEKVLRNIEEFEDKITVFAKNQIRYEEEVIAHNKSKKELMKMKMKVHKINTWLKWAKPAVDDDEKCQCFRHTAGRK